MKMLRTLYALLVAGGYVLAALSPVVVVVGLAAHCGAEDRAMREAKPAPSLAAVRKPEVDIPTASAETVLARARAESAPRDDRPRTSNGKTAFDIENGCRALIHEKVDDADFPGWRDARLAEPVVTSHGAVWKGWFRAPNAFNAKIRHTFACRYIARTDMLTVRFDE